MGKRVRRGLLLVAAGVVALLAAACGPTPPTPNADYQFYASQFGRPASCAATPGPSLFQTYVGTDQFQDRIESVDGVNEHVQTFGHGNGYLLHPTTGEVRNDAYSIVMLFRLSEIGGYDRLIDFKYGASDSGVYLYNGQLRFYRGSTTGFVTGSKVIANDEYAQVVVTRAADGIMRGFVDGVQQWQFTDTTGDGLVSSDNKLRFFLDNNGDDEHSAGAVARIRVFDRPLTTTEVSNLGQTPGSPCTG
jgi:hypothetical protein